MAGFGRPHALLASVIVIRRGAGPAGAVSFFAVFFLATVAGTAFFLSVVFCILLRRLSLRRVHQLKPQFRSVSKNYDSNVVTFLANVKICVTVTSRFDAACGACRISF